MVALSAALGRVPQLTFQVPDGDEGHLPRIFRLLKSCRVSIHDLNAVGIPVRFNMPFELGLACAIKQQTGRHDFLALERKSHRLRSMNPETARLVHRGWFSSDTGSGWSQG